MRFEVAKNKNIFNLANQRILKYDILELDISLGSTIERGLYLLLSNPNKSCDFVNVLPLKEYVENNECYGINIPAISMPNDMIKKYQKKDNAFILYFLNNNNPHIRKAISLYFLRKQPECSSHIA